MFLLRRAVQSARPLPRFVSSSSSVKNSNPAIEPAMEKEEPIEIPDSIPRSPTDILQALANTVGYDPTAAHYKYHDDPYLIPMSNVGKRTFAMAQESGRKAAKWIKEEHRDLFMHSEAQPPIKAFAPRLVFNEESEVDEGTLRDLIMQSEITDAVFVFNLMKQKGVEISPAMKQSLLELVCFYNNNEPLPEDLIEERWFKSSTGGRESQSPTWKDGELAEKLFAEIEPKTASSYSALIRGMAKYYQAERAYALLQEANEKQLLLDTTTYNSVIGIAHLVKETADQRWDLCSELLKQMAQLQLHPNVGTLNALLYCVSTFTNYKFARSSALKVFKEFKLLNVQPCLASYYYLLIIFCRERGPVSHVLVDILVELQGKEFKIIDPKDTYFFATAMDICRNHLHDRSVAKKVDELLHVGNNYNLLGDTYKEAIYYRHYFGLLCQTEPLEEFMRTYDLLVPNIYIPEPGVMEEILKAVEMNAAIELVPRMWSDILIFDHTNRESILTRMLKIMIENKPNVENFAEKNLPEQFAKVALDIYNKIEEQRKGRVQKLAFTGQMIGDILTLVVRGGDYEKAVEIFTKIDKSQHLIPGTPSEACMSEFIDACIANKAPSQAISCLQYCVENHMESMPLARQINDGFTLNEFHISKMKSLLGDEFLKPKPDPEAAAEA